MNLGQVLKGVALREPMAPETARLEIAGLAYDSREAGKDFLFFAFAGARVDGREFAKEAVGRGAAAVVSELPRPEDFAGGWVHVEHGRRALAAASKTLYGRPDERVHFTGITGTNGKTTTAFVLEAILREAGFITGLTGTIEYRLAGEARKAPNTTPESLDTMRFADELVRRGGSHLIAEVSSHALALGRVFGFYYHTAVFTNLTRDHLDFHGTMEEYAAAKRLLFAPETGDAPAWSVLNRGDEASVSMVNKKSRVVWYGMSSAAELRAERVSTGFEGLQFEVRFGDARQAVESGLAGRINVLNILAASGAALSYGVDLETIARGVANCKAVPGRFERIDRGQPFMVAVDYAHTDDALRNAIQVAREMTRGRVITLFGCGGDRDRAKRPLMGMAAGELSDYVVLTSDNPRSEDPLGIINDALVGLRRFDTPHNVELDRGAAIRTAIKQAKAGDVVLIAGKGHEPYQVLKDRTIHFDDRETARAVLVSLGYEPDGD
jgi:UDP-N-acetylmuramoyl-L-alanyl-D-glutamate--2,6-diaminopimelate ligase